MTRPGTLLNQTTSPPIRSAPTDTGVWFVAGPTMRGPTTAQRVTSMAVFKFLFGDRTTSSLLYDSLDLAFNEGVPAAYIARVLGPGSATASFDLLDGAGSPRVSLRATAVSAGDWGSLITITVDRATTSGFKLTVVYTDTNGKRTTEIGDNLATQADAVTWANSSSLIRLALGVSTDIPAVTVARSLTGGRDDLGNVRDDQYATALTQFGRDLGPGQVSIPGRTTAATYSMVNAHCRWADRKRVGLLDEADTNSTTTLKSAISAVRIDNDSDNVSAFFAPWVTIPGLIPGTTRTVPPCALVAGRIGETDARYSANQPAAGIGPGLSRYAIGLTQTFTDDQFDDLSANGVNVIRQTYEGINVFGWRSMIDPDGDTSWLGFNSVRLYAQIAAILDDVALRHVFRVIDGAQTEISKFYSDLVGELIPFFESGDLYGETVADAFFVDVGSTVNTPATIAAGELHANVGIRMSPFNEYTVININKVPIEGSVA